MIEKSNQYQKHLLESFYSTSPSIDVFFEECLFVQIQDGKQSLTPTFVTVAVRNIAATILHKIADDLIDQLLSKGSVIRTFTTFSIKTLTSLFSITLAQRMTKGIGLSPPSGKAMLFGAAFAGIFQIHRRQNNQPFFKKDSLITEITEKNFKTEVLESTLPVVMDVYGKHCPPCKSMAPIVSDLSKKLEGKVKFVALNISENGKLATELKITKIPTFIFFKNGKLLSSHVGAINEQNLIDKIDTVFAKAKKPSYFESFFSKQKALAS